MGLILGVKRKEKVYVGEDWFRVVKVMGQQNFVVENADKTAYTINGPDDQPQEVIPEVWVSAGLARSESPENHARVFIKAPNDLLILRQQPYRTVCLYEDAADTIEWLIGAAKDQDGLQGNEEEEARAMVQALEKEIKKLSRSGG